MKIGIISINMYSKNLNFACPLHTYAFQQFLLQNGIETTIINYKPIYYDNFNLRHPYEYYKKKYDDAAAKAASLDEIPQSLQDKLKEYAKKRDSYESLYTEREIRYDKFQNFIDTNYIKTDFCYDSDLIEVMDPGFDCYICATDVIWKNQPNVGFDHGFFLFSSTMENKWKIAYSASRGVYFASSEDENREFFQCIDDIDFISVREASLKNYIEENTDKKVSVVLDPVLLHDREFYEKIAVKPQEEHYILLYYVMERAADTISQAVAYAREHHMKIVEITDLPLKEGRLKKYDDIDRTFYYAIGIEEWLGFFQHADCVFTNSFHACCLCILFKKNFYTGFRHGDKVTNLLETFDLMDRKINIEKEPPAKNYYQKAVRWLRRHLKSDSGKPRDIDYGKVYKILEQKRAESRDFILSAIHQAETQTKPARDYDAYKKSLTYHILYNSQLKRPDFTWDYPAELGEMTPLATGSLEFKSNALMKNDGSARLLRNGFALEHHRFLGWNIRVKFDNRWFWYLQDRSLKHKPDYKKETDGPKYLFKDEDAIPTIPVNHISLVVAEAVWEEMTDSEKD